LKTILSYIVIFAMLTLFTLFLDAVSGLFIIFILIGAIVISTALHIYAVKKFDCDISANAVLIEKNEEVRLTVRVSKAPFFLPSVFEIKLKPSYHFDCADGSMFVTLGRAEKERVFILKSEFWGKSAVELEYIKCRDILGIVSSLKFLHINAFPDIIGKNHVSVKIFPAIPDLSERSELVRVLEDASAYDDNEQNREVPGAVIGFPGYEHRDYVPGDPLKSVNWKLSAKRDRLLVRKPESYAGGDQVFILDSEPCPVIGDKQARLTEQKCLEAMLALTRVMTGREIICRVYVKLGVWEVREIDGEDGIEALRFALTEYSFNSQGGRLPDISAEKASGFVVFSASADGRLLALTESYKQKGIMPEIASPEPSRANWLIDESHGEVIFTAV